MGRALIALASGDRFEMMLAILDGDNMSFNRLKDEFQMTNGNLAHHIKLLKEAGLVIERENITDGIRFLVATPYAERLVRCLFHASKVRK